MATLSPGLLGVCIYGHSLYINILSVKWHIIVEHLINVFPGESVISYKTHKPYHRSICSISSILISIIYIGSVGQCTYILSQKSI